MKASTFISTVIHLRPEQILFRIIRRLHTPGFKEVECPDTVCFKHQTHPISKPESLKDGVFTFLNLSSLFNAWDNDCHGPLWDYNLNYMDWIGQPGVTPHECALWIDRFISDFKDNSIALAPYPTALRCINWIKFFCDNRSCATPDRINHLYSQLSLLSRKTERNIGGNHLLEDAFALTIGSAFFGDRKMAGKAVRILKRELKRQILPDGAHYEQSPMYHCILLDRLLDCINYTSGRIDDNLFPAGFNSLLSEYAKTMTGHLKSIVWPDRTIPLLNDSAYGIAPQYSELLDYAIRLGVESDPAPMNECGYRRFTDGRIDVIADIGNITAKDQPGHTHADTFSYELRIDGKPYITDTGISTYNKNDRRQYERGTPAHNTVTVDEKDSSGVWGGFRVAGRAKVKIEQDSDRLIVASHDGYGRSAIHTRSFRLEDKTFSIQDICNTHKDTVSRIHFAPDVRILSADTSTIVTDNGSIHIEGAVRLDIKDVESSVEYNVSRRGKVAEISFRNRLAYTLHVNP
ncbi:MAG: alginate lyase family protein [Bacteroidaceae bacterium]|nr:alginate lyase family protein [Bacteroidaceae bacterium]